MTTPPSTFDSALREALAAPDAAPDAAPGSTGPAARDGTTAPASPGRRARSSRPRAQARSFPVTVTQLPSVPCQVCGEPVAHRRGELTAALTTHYEREHPDLLGG